MYVDHIYDKLAKECGGLDAVYEDFIIHVVGITGLVELMSHRLIETCGVVNGRQLYTLLKNVKAEG